MTKRAIPLLVALAVGLPAAAARSEEASGTVVFDVKPFTSQVELKPKLREELQAGGVKWGTQGGQLVVSMVNPRLIHFDLPYVTGYGNRREIELAPGTYHLTCIGYIAAGGLTVAKALDKGAYFNLDVLTFRVAAGKTTLLEVQPTVREHADPYEQHVVPEFVLKVTEDGVAGSEVVINDRTGTSIPWRNYEGDLRF